MQLKIKAAEKQGKDATRFLAEESSLEDALKNWQDILAEQFYHLEGYEARLYDIGQQVNALTAVNSLLWDAEDQVRALPEPDQANLDQIFHLANLCKQIAMLNDKRADLVRAISQLYGENEEVHEKIYGAKIGV